MKKRLLAIVLILLLMLSLSSCADKEDCSAVVVMSINPEFRIFLDSDLVVIEIAPINNDAKKVCGEVDVVGMYFSDAAATLADMSAKLGYLVDGKTIDLVLEQVPDDSVSAGIRNELLYVNGNLESIVSELGINASVQVTVSESLGECHTTCETCQGIGTVICEDCQGSGIITCPDCNGEGIIHCAQCGDSGCIDCTVCGGTGVTSTQCELCMGTGICPECNGSGIKAAENDSPEEEWENHGVVENYESCEACGGTGKCANCAGLGFDKCSSCQEHYSEEEGYVINPYGAGKVECPACHGTPNAPCETCGGTGNISCTCELSGRRWCPDCGGTGYTD